jgi:hypothetical protein
MGVLLSKYGLRGDVQPLVGFAVPKRALGAEAEEWDATGVMRAGGCR